MKRVAGGQRREQVPEAMASNGEEPLIRGDGEHRLGDAERDDLRVSDPSSCIPRPLGQEIVGGAEHRYQQQIEVGVHSRPPEGRRLALQSTADFDLPAYVPFSTATNPPGSVAQLI